jgi:hypothetical protein
VFAHESPSHLETDDRWGPFVFGDRLLYLLGGFVYGLLLANSPPAYALAGAAGIGLLRFLPLLLCTLVGALLTLWSPLGLDPFKAAGVWLLARRTPVLAVWAPAPGSDGADEPDGWTTERARSEW